MRAHFIGRRMYASNDQRRQPSQWRGRSVSAHRVAATAVATSVATVKLTRQTQLPFTTRLPTRHPTSVANNAKGDSSRHATACIDDSCAQTEATEPLQTSVAESASGDRKNSRAPLASCPCEVGTRSAFSVGMKPTAHDSRSKHLPVGLDGLNAPGFGAFWRLLSNSPTHRRSRFVDPHLPKKVREIPPLVPTDVANHNRHSSPDWALCRDGPHSLPGAGVSRKPSLHRLTPLFLHPEFR